MASYGLYTLLTATGTATGTELTTGNNDQRSFQAVCTGTGAVTADAIIEGSNDKTNWITLTTISLSGTAPQTGGFNHEAAWTFIRARTANVTGTGASVTVTVSLNRKREERISDSNSVVVTAANYGVSPLSLDNTTALQAAIDAAASPGSGATFGGAVILPEGVLTVKSPISLKNRVRVIGAGKRTTTIKADAAFSGSYVIFMDDDTNYSFDSRLEHLGVDCSDIAGLSGIRARTLQEGSGVSSVLVSNYRLYGIHLSQNTGATRDVGNTHWIDVELYCSGSGATAGLFAATPGVGGANLLLRFTVNSNGATSHTYGFDLQSGYWNIQSGHFEKCGTGLRCGANSNGLTQALTGGNGCTTVVRLDSTNWTLLETVRDLSTNIIDDAAGAGIIWTDTFLRHYTPNTQGFQIQQCIFRVGSGTPEGAVTARPGSIFLNNGGGALTTLYVKTSGTGNTGWTAK